MSRSVPKGAIACRFSVCPECYTELFPNLGKVIGEICLGSESERMVQINRLMKGCLHNFKYAHTYEKLKQLDGWVRKRLRYCIWKHWKKPKKRRRSFIRLGVPHG